MADPTNEFLTYLKEEIKRYEDARKVHRMKNKERK